ncbi:MAG: hypothetical protein CFE26_04995 [Verrucomicrobiales bacterium VVV1]|nr:MAG: hypothetical protein CFE26_04995 [Verrucomicrobiales bacterium VVV1]
MTAFDLYSSPIRQDDPEMVDQFCSASSPPAIVQIVDPPADDPWDYRNLAEAYRWRLEVTLHEVGAAHQVERYYSENGVDVESTPDDVAPTTVGELTSLPDKLKIRFGIGMKHLAAALGVERPAVYAWMKGERLPQPKRWGRIPSLSELANFWQEHSSHPLSRRAFVPVESGLSVMDLLSAESLDLSKIKEVLKKLATAENDRSARLREKAVAMRERMKSRSVMPLPDVLVDQTLRDLGGR